MKPIMKDYIKINIGRVAFSFQSAVGRGVSGALANI